MIQLNPFKQTPSYCGPASLKVLLEYYGKNFTEDELASLCKSTVEMGTSNSDLVDAVTSLGLHPVVKTNATIDDLRISIKQKTPILVGWVSDDEPHFSIVVDVDNTHVQLMDPEYGEDGFRMPIDQFSNAWHDYDSKLGQSHTHWMLTISP